MKRAAKQISQPRGTRQYNRTPLATYRRADAPIQSPFQNRPASTARRKYLIGAADIFLIIILIISLIYSLLLNANPAVIASNQSYRSSAEYAKLIRPDFNGLGNKNKISFKEASVISRIKEQFPEVSSVAIELPFFSEQARVRLLVSPPAFKLKSHGQLFVVDQQGIVVTNRTAQSQFAKLLTVADQSGFMASVGQPVLSAQSASFICTVIDQVQRAKVPISAITLPAIPLELDLRTRDGSYFAKFYLNGDANLQAGQFLAARQKFDQSHISPSQYLDVRVAGKVFYK